MVSQEFPLRSSWLTQHVALFAIVVCSTTAPGCRSPRESPAAEQALPSSFIVILAADIAHGDFLVKAQSLRKLSAFLVENRDVDPASLEPLAGPLVSCLGWGGLGRKYSRSAAHVLEFIGARAIPPLVEGTRSGETGKKVAAGAVLSAIRPVDSRAMDALIALGRDTDGYVRRECFRYLAKMGPDGARAIPMLRAAVADPYSDCRLYCHYALYRITGETAPHIAKITTVLRDSDKDTRLMAVELLGEIGPPAHQSWVFLLRALNDEDRCVRSCAAGTLRKIGADEPDVLDGLIRALREDKDLAVRGSMAHALGGFGPKARRAIPALVAFLKDAIEAGGGWKTNGYFAAGTLRDIGGPQALAALKEMPSDGDTVTARSIRRAIAELEQPTETQ